ncbi:unnamed protein product [Lactuca virosa]|uniref:Alpha,alpha-trehalose-phosphate synthase (UDP-forming) n=1 Tax=Lactuca virosa TaxID=75947 RepID=A0AAU9PSD8_9ASTR|nr:unnamed protein product [Lactuca virosa]
MDRSIDFHALCALYSVTDIALITPLREGMNLISYEFLACQDAKRGVLILSEFAGAAQSLGAGAILVNPWNIPEVAASIYHALNMSTEEREKRYLHNFLHVTNYTAQVWAETLLSALNDTVVEAQLRIRQLPPPLPVEEAIERYVKSSNRLLILGFNATLTDRVDTLNGCQGNQIREMDLKLHPDLKETLTRLCGDPKTTIILLSGSGRAILDENFGEYNMWLAAENGMFLRSTKGDWMMTMPEHLNMYWVDSIKHVFAYFTERTPQSYIEIRETSLIWNYKYADVEFGRLQARDMLQYLWTGSISNASVDVVHGDCTVEVRPFGVTKGLTIGRILGEINNCKSISAPINYVLCIGHSLGKDEDIYTIFEPEFPSRDISIPRLILSDITNPFGRSGSQKHTHELDLENKQNNNNDNDINNVVENGNRQSSPFLSKLTWNLLDLERDNYFSCAVGKTRTKAHYLLPTSDDVVSLLKGLALAS